MNKKIISNVVFAIILIAFVGAVTYLVLYQKPTQIGKAQLETSIKYTNTEYSFNFSLPKSWKGYSIISKAWEGNIIDSQISEKVQGPEILIRHPLWTSANPRQDIPIMIFTQDQWNLIQQEKLSLGAAPIGPSELGRNSKYIFALPARYNYAFPIGFEEVQKIIEGKPLSAF